MSEESIYQAKVLEHAKSPRHYGEPREFLASRTGVNPLCGDEVTFYLVHENGAQVLQFVSKGCALCRASASFLTASAAASPASEWARLVPGEELREIGRKFPSRLRCVELPWETFARLLDEPISESP